MRNPATISNIPVVDILMATYNGEKYVAEQIESIQVQEYPNWRLLISDDCSTDRTLEIIKKYAGSDTRIKVVSSGVSHGSAKSTFLSLMAFSNSQYVMFCDQDDVWLPAKISVTLNKMFEVEKGQSNMPCLVYTDMAVVDSELQVINPSFGAYSGIDPTRVSFKQVLAQSLGAGCTMMFNKTLLDIMQKTPDGQFMIMHDWWLTLLASAFGKIGYVSDATSMYRQHGDNSVGAARFSVLSHLAHYGVMRERMTLCLRQAQSFYDVYKNELSGKDREAAKLFASILESKHLSGLLNLIKSGCWKKGARKIGQFLVVLTK